MIDLERPLRDLSEASLLRKLVRDQEAIRSARRVLDAATQEQRETAHELDLRHFAVEGNSAGVPPLSGSYEEGVLLDGKLFRRLGDPGDPSRDWVFSEPRKLPNESL